LAIKQKGWQVLPESWYPERQIWQILVPLQRIQLFTPQLGTQLPLEKVLLLVMHVQMGVEELAGVVAPVPEGQLHVPLEGTKEGRQVSQLLFDLQTWQLATEQPMQKLAIESRVKFVEQALQAPVYWLQLEQF
jgi:hypothetical protein